jgi:NADH:ubiquinone oxidoreductase subunit E
MSDTQATIEICMGSSCFSRGNPENLRAVRDYLATQGLAATVRVAGHLCEDQCSEGPNLRVNGRVFRGVTPAGVKALLDAELKGGRPR